VIDYHQTSFISSFINDPLSLSTKEEHVETLPPSAHRRPPTFHSSKPVPCTSAGCYAFHAYHSNVAGAAAGYGGWADETAAAARRCEDRQKAVLRRVGLGESGRGDWDALGASSLLFAMDPHYLEAKGFLQIGGGPFTPDLGLRPHVARYAKALKRDYDAAFKRGVSKGEHRILSLLASQFPESEREWDVEQTLTEPDSILELYQRAAAAAPALWDVQLAVAKRVGLMAATDDDNEGGGSNTSRRRGRRSGSGDGEGGEDAAEEECLAASWNLKLLGPRLRAKAAKHGGFKRVTDVLRGSLVFETAQQLSEGLVLLVSGELFAEPLAVIATSKCS
jgi:hypothetical protein